MLDQSTTAQAKVAPRIIIHGGSGNITRQSLSKERYSAYQSSLNNILASSTELLSRPGATALDVATYAVSLLEDDPLYDSGKGAVFTSEGKVELECSIMVSKGFRKRSVGCMMLRHVKNPIKLARQLLIQGEARDGGGAQDHCQYSGVFVEELARKWALDMVEPSYFFTQERWDEHRRGLEEKRHEEQGMAPNPSITEISDWEKENYIPLGTCGAVVLDSFGTICTATSTGGLTNKVPGRIGDTPTAGAGFWAEEWSQDVHAFRPRMLYQPTVSTPLDKISRGQIGSLIGDCLPTITPARSDLYEHTSSSDPSHEKPTSIRHAVGISGTGNGDTFVRLAAASTTTGRTRFTPTSLHKALPWMAGPGGELQRSAADRWGHTHEGVGGMIGIELVGNKGTVVYDYNCGGMFRAWIDEHGEQQCLIFREDSYESGPAEWGTCLRGH